MDDEQRLVTGIASGYDEDLDGEGIDPEWLKQEMTDWHNRWANIREMHDRKAIGTATDLDWDEENRPILTSHILDDDAWNKVKAGVYKGYSIGIKNTKKVLDPRYRKGRIVGGKIIETSLVDRPAYDGALITSYKTVLMEEDAQWQSQTALAHREEVNKMADAVNAKDSHEAKKDRIRTALSNSGQGLYIVRTFPDCVIASDWNDGNFYNIPYEDDGENVTLGNKEPVEQSFGPVADDDDVQKAAVASRRMASLIAEVGKAVWTKKDIDELPDSSFAFIASGGEKKDGVTEPKSLRKLPYKDKDGKIDAPHVRDALARLDQTEDIPDDEKEKVKEKLEDALKEVDNTDEEKTATLKAAAIKALVALGADSEKAAQSIDYADMTILTNIADLAERMAKETGGADGAVDFPANSEPQKNESTIPATQHIDEEALEARIMGKVSSMIEKAASSLESRLATADSSKAASIEAEVTKSVSDLASRLELIENTVTANTVKTVAIERQIGVTTPETPKTTAADAFARLQETASKLSDTAQRDLTADAIKTLVYGGAQ